MKKFERETVMSKSTAQVWMRMFNFLYRLGVEDACEKDDEGACREFVEKTAKVGVWGLLTDRRLTDDPVDWQVTLTYLSRRIFCSNSLTMFFLNMGRFGKNYFSAAPVIAQEWYRKGVSDYLANPERELMSQFKSRQHAFWTKEGIRNFTSPQLVEVTQVLIRDRRVTDSEDPDHRYSLKDHYYQWFRQRVSSASATAMRKYYG